jgi:hypothetical protein
MGWTQPICLGCFRMREGREPNVVLRDAEPETCCVCGHVTKEGVYTRIDPKSVPYPAQD